MILTFPAAARALLLCAAASGAAIPDPATPILFGAPLPPAWSADPQVVRGLATREEIASPLRFAWKRADGALLGVFVQDVPEFFPPEFFAEVMPGELASAFGVPAADLRSSVVRTGGIPVCRVEARGSAFDPTGARAADTEAAWWNIEIPGRDPARGAARYLDVLVLYRGPAGSPGRAEAEAWVEGIGVDPARFRPDTGPARAGERSTFAAAPGEAPPEVRVSPAPPSDEGSSPGGGSPGNSLPPGEGGCMPPEAVRLAVRGWISEALAEGAAAGQAVPVILVVAPSGRRAGEPGLLAPAGPRGGLEYRASAAGIPVSFPEEVVARGRLEGDALVLDPPEGRWVFRVDAGFLLRRLLPGADPE